jgi:amino acid adenylation domain-containing protein/thioester reductase-like protein
VGVYGESTTEKGATWGVAKLPGFELTEEQRSIIVHSAYGGLANIEDVYPLSPLQEGMLFHHLLNKNGDTYVLAAIMELEDGTQTNRLVDALRQVIERHDILRSAIRWEQLSTPVQIVHRRVRLDVERLFLDPALDAVTQIKKLTLPGQQRWDLRKPPLVRIQVAPDVGKRGWFALLQVHHLVCDYQSLNLLLAETLKIVDGRTAELSAPQPYREYVNHARAHAQELDSEHFFREKLGGIDEPTAPFGFLTVHGDGSRLREFSDELDDSLVQCLRSLSRQHGVSVARLIHAVWAVVVARTSGREDIVLGTVVLAEKLRGLATRRMMGMAVNTLPLRIRLHGVSVQDLVGIVHSELSELLRYDYAPLSLTQRFSDIVGHAPLFTALLNYRHRLLHPTSETERIRVIATSDGWTNYPITLRVDDSGKKIRITAQTDELIDPERIVRYMQNCTNSLAIAMERSLSTPALDLEILSDADRCWLTQAEPAVARLNRADMLIHQLFERQVQRQPDAIAVVYEGQLLSYLELNDRANKLARRLRHEGIEPDQRVGVFIERGLDLVVAILGILKAGAAYVPLDTKHPSERLKVVLADAAPPVVLTHTHLESSLPQTPAKAVLLDREWSKISTYSGSNLDPATVGVFPHHLAYVIFTSGSTGTPKGVMIEHGNVVSHWLAIATLYEVPYDCRRIAMNAPTTFDASVQQLVQVLSGRTVLIVPEALRIDPVRMVQFIRDHQIQGIDCTPSQLRSWISADLLDPVQWRPRTVLVGGEPIDSALWEKLVAEGGVEFHNVYGPTECTVDSTSAHLRGSVREPHIGKPLRNTHIYVLDSRGNLAPIGVRGEIYIGGGGVGRGYLNRRELTEMHFLKDPFNADPSGRMYRSGDVGRWREDGNLEYLGRNDYQVKIRGYRIELGEIEAQLIRHPDVQEAVVVAREDIPGQKRLVAYVVAGEDCTEKGVEPHGLRAHLASLLPQYMVPSAFVVIDRLPLTRNGKVNRSALPVPDLEAYVDDRYEPPLGDVEEVLAAVWQQILRVRRVGRNDSFFGLGGHSLLIMQMLERLRPLGLAAEVRHVWENPRLSDLARVLTGDVARGVKVPRNLIPRKCDAITPDMVPLVRLEPVDISRIARTVAGGMENIQDIYPLAPSQEGLLFHRLLDEKHSDIYILPTLLEVSSPARLEQLIAAFQAVIDRHDALRTAVLWEGLPRPIQVVYRTAQLPVEVLAPVKDRDVLGEMKSRMSPERQVLDLRRAPLLRLQVVRTIEGPQVYVLLQVHHIVCDHITAETIVSEVVAHLEGRFGGLPPSIPYRDHVAQALTYADTGAPEHFWREQLKDLKEPIAPFGLVDVRGDGTLISEASRDVDSALSLRLRTQARHHGVSVATLFHIGWALVLSCLTGRDDIVFGTVLLGRMRADTAGAVALGMFINTLPFRIKLGNTTVGKLVIQSQRELVELISHELASLAMVQHCSHVGSTPLFTTLLNYRHTAIHPEDQWSGAPGIRLLAYQERTNYPIVVCVDDRKDGFSLTAQTTSTVEPSRIIGYLETALGSLVDVLERAPETSPQLLTALPSAERMQVIEEFNATAAAYPRDSSIAEVFERQVELTPDAIALTGITRVTYAELNRRANRLGHYLRALGVSVGECVAISISRTHDLIIAQLAALKCGAAFAPIDPDLPVERQRFILRDCGARYVLALKDCATKFGDQSVLCLDLASLSLDGDGLSTGNIRLEISGLSPAYVMYRSASKVIPRGAMVPHRAVTRLVVNHGYAHIDPADWIADSNACCVDACTFEIWACLLNGASVLVIPQDVVSAKAAFSDALIAHGATVLWLTVSMVRRFADTLSGVFHRLRHLVTTGGAVNSRIVRQALGCNPSMSLINVYGPTECAAFSTAHHVRVDDQTDRLRLGKPTGNTRVYILDRRMQPVPLGVAGDIYVGGDGLALGYANRPELTATCFVASPFCRVPGARIYRTGDLGRWRPDGIIEYLGRDDRRVKVRGVRVELEEIERRLACHSQVAEAVVLAREDVVGGKRLVAYLTVRLPSEGESAVSAKSLQAYLHATLPDYMVPRAFVVVKSFPLTATGEIDQRALPEPDSSADLKQRYEAPSGALEQTIALVWQEVLGIESVSRFDNFFELGGHSLLALRSLVLLKHRLGAELSGTDIYRNPTVRELGERIRDGIATEKMIDLSQEASLEEEIWRSPEQVRVQPRGVLLTGATGFVGRFLLRQLLRDTEALLYCLVRGASLQEAKRRLKDIVSKWDLEIGDLEGRIVVVPGDLSLPCLGVDRATYLTLEREVDCIYHCATSMNHLETYSMAKRTNVEGAKELLRLAASGTAKVVNYVSSLSVFSALGYDRARVVAEASPIDSERHPHSSGYAASKWVGEKLFMLANSRGLSCNIFRLGLVWADSEKGRYDELQREYRIVKTSFLCGYGIKDYRLQMPPIPVDYAARSIVFLAARHTKGGGIFHLSSHRRPERGLFERCNDIVQRRLTLLPVYEWVSEVKRINDGGKSLPVAPLLDVVFPNDSQERSRVERTGIEFDCSKTNRELEDAGLVHPVVTDTQLALFLEWMFCRDPQFCDGSAQNTLELSRGSTCGNTEVCTADRQVRVP